MIRYIHIVFDKQENKSLYSGILGKDLFFYPEDISEIQNTIQDYKFIVPLIGENRESIHEFMVFISSLKVPLYHTPYKITSTLLSTYNSLILAQSYNVETVKNYKIFKTTKTPCIKILNSLIQKINFPVIVEPDTYKSPFHSHRVENPIELEECVYNLYENTFDNLIIKEIDNEAELITVIVKEGKLVNKMNITLHGKRIKYMSERLFRFLELRGIGVFIFHVTTQKIILWEVDIYLEKEHLKLLEELNTTFFN